MGYNIDFYCNHTLDALYQQEQATADPGARQQIFDADPSDLPDGVPFHRALQPDRSLDRAQGDAQLPARALWRRGDRQHLGVVVR